MTRPTGGQAVLLGIVGALGLTFLGMGVNASAVQALGLAATAGIGLSAMLRGPGLRMMGGLGILLAVAAGISAGLAGGWAWLGLVFCVALGTAGFLTLHHGPRWRARSRTREKEPARDLWKQFDAGDDPTTSDEAPDPTRD